MNTSIINLNKALAMFALFLLIGITNQAQGQLLVKEDSKQFAGETKGDFDPSAKWYERIKMGGYIQVKHNGLFETNEDFNVEQMDKNWGADKGITLRRMRWKFQGWVHERVFFYTQIDAASGVSLKDAYMDLYVEPSKRLWIRAGQSKVPYGFENMQSSSQRIALDRSDPINSAFKDEREMGVHVMYTPHTNKNIYKFLKKNNLKHNGNYGTFSLSAINGQGMNRPDVNENRHVIGRASWPFQFTNKQVLEIAAQGYTGKYQLVNPSDNLEGFDNGETFAADGHDWDDYRYGFTFVYYPQPIGFQAEYNWGSGPEFDAKEGYVTQQDLQGGYAQVMGRFKIKDQSLMPFTRFLYYDGGKKHELDARSYKVNDWEFGVEWQPNKAFEVVMQYTVGNRRYEDSGTIGNYQEGNVLRVQLQVNL